MMLLSVLQTGRHITSSSSTRNIAKLCKFFKEFQLPHCTLSLSLVAYTLFIAYADYFSYFSSLLFFFCIKYYCKLHDRKRVWPQNGGQAQGNVRVARQFFFSFRILQAQLRAGNVAKKQTFLLSTHTHTHTLEHTPTHRATKLGCAI